MPSFTFYFATGFPGFILLAMGLSFGSSWHSDVVNSPAAGIMVFIGIIFLLVAAGGFIRDLNKSYRDWRIEERDKI